ncbi:MAG: nucleotidyl transferase AbiEii/AbiGii toxin family protein [Lachnospiraceae bacterium]|nr:nucleotidyl transferase AbiEii/AbiGii toxin family protein [Lachnospiraceae bacterium]
MLSKDNFTRDHIEDLRKVNGNDPALLERTIYAFGLLEAIRRAGMPFIFKGGTALLLLLDKPMRLSTDIDIIVEPGVDVDSYIREAGKIFPFLDSEEDIRIGRNKIEKRHYKFLYKSPLTGRSFNILLDVLFEENPYSTVVERPIRNSLLLTEGQDLTVSLPGINCILGDKLTAFAPHTTGIPFGAGKELEVIKQMYDCWTLFQGMDDFKEVGKVYQNVVAKELAYRALDLQPEDVLSDTIRSCLCLMGRGSIGKDEYPLYADGIDRIQGHVFSGVFNGENAGIHACSILYIVASMLSGQKFCNRIEKAEEYQDVALKVKNAKRITYIKRIDLVAYAYLIEAYNMLGDEYFILK